MNYFKCIFGYFIKEAVYNEECFHLLYCTFACWTVKGIDNICEEQFIRTSLTDE